MLGDIAAKGGRWNLVKLEAKRVAAAALFDKAIKEVQRESDRLAELRYVGPSQEVLEMERLNNSVLASMVTSTQVSLPESFASAPKAVIVSDEDMAEAAWEDSITAKLEDQLGREPTADEVAEAKMLDQQERAAKEAAADAAVEEMVERLRPLTLRRAAAALTDNMHRQHMRTLRLMPSPRTPYNHEAHRGIEKLDEAVLATARRDPPHWLLSIL